MSLMIGQRKPWSDVSPSSDSSRLQLKGEDWPKLGTPGAILVAGKARRPLTYLENDKAGNGERRRERRGQRDEVERRGCCVELPSGRTGSEDFDSLRSPIGSKQPKWKQKRSWPTKQRTKRSTKGRKPLFVEREPDVHDTSIDKESIDDLTEHRIEKRQKQIDFGKNTIAYDRYIKAVPKDARTKMDPLTPDKKAVCSKRAFDGRIRQWRVKLHNWDPPRLISACSEESKEDGNDEDEEEEFDPASMTLTGWESLDDGIRKLGEEDKENVDFSGSNSIKDEDDEMSEIDWEINIPMSDWSLLMGDDDD